MDKKYLIEELNRIAKKHNVIIDEEALGDIIALSTIRVVTKGDILSSMGDNTSVAGLVLSGIARSYYIDKDGNDITRGFAVAGTMCMDEGFFGYEERICMWEALEDTTVMFFDVKEVKKRISENDKLKDTWITLLENALRYKIYRENGFLVENATERYAHFKKMFPKLSERVPQKHIATYLGIAPESLSRIRSAMKE